MPPKKRNQGKDQPTLVKFMANQIPESNQMPLERKLEKESQKLLKLRREMDQKRREEQRLMRNILKLQISDNNNHQLPFVEDEEYWVMTSQSSLGNQSTSLLKMMLSDYGSVIIDKFKQVEVAKTQISQAIEEETQWRQKGHLNSSYLSSYSSDFINSLKEYQYLAVQMLNQI